MKYLHIMSNSTFTRPFINFIKENFDFEDHIFIISDGDFINKFEIEKNEQKNIIILNSEDYTYLNLYKYYIQIISFSKSVDKVFIHGLYRHKLMLVLFLAPWILKKYYWIIWGSDLYNYRVRKNNIKSFILEEVIKKSIVKKFGGMITYIKGDYELATKWYGAKCKYYECFMYPSNLYKEYEVLETEHKTINIQVGNSATPSNNHLEIFQKLLKFKDEDINIFVPLSYGDGAYAKEVIMKGRELFGDKFKPMVNFIQFDEYLKFLGSIDIAIFAHKRQQAMGNIITLLGLGKKVYIRDDITPWKLFEDIGVKVFSFDDLTLSLMSLNIKNENKQNIKRYFSEENYLKQLKKIFES